MNDDLQLDMRSHNETVRSNQRLVFLGASNLSRAFPHVVSMSQRVFDTPTAFYVAKGHGRSYGIESSCLGKKISGIFSCGIWQALNQEKSVPITAFMTDIGNDLAYEVPVETILDWVEACLDRLLSHGARVALSDLPVDILKQVGTTKFRLTRAVLFPQCSLALEEIVQRAESLSVGLQELAKQREVPLFVGRNEWYGLDPIHPRRRYLPVMWTEIFSQVTSTPSDLSSHRCPWLRGWALRRLQPESWSMLGFHRRASQPCGRLKDGSTISLY